MSEDDFMVARGLTFSRMENFVKFAEALKDDFSKHTPELDHRFSLDERKITYIINDKIQFYMELSEDSDLEIYFQYTLFYMTKKLSDRNFDDIYKGLSKAYKNQYQRILNEYQSASKEIEFRMLCLETKKR